MDLELASLHFNYDPEGSSSSALNIRRNLTTIVTLPEYQKGKSRVPEDSPVAYPIRETLGAPVFVKASFLRANLEHAVAYEVGALGGGVLGSIDPAVLEFPAGKRAVDILLRMGRRTFDAVGRHDVSWTWRARPRREKAAWVALGTTSHRVYVLLSAPARPWISKFNSQKAAWTDLLDFSCQIARGAQDAHSATCGMVKAINSGYRLKYDIENGAREYFGAEFRLTAWVERVLHGRRCNRRFLPGCAGREYWRDWVVNCRDVGGAVTLMSTILGAAVSYVEQSPFGFLRVVEPIGRGFCNNPFYKCRGDPIVPAGKGRTKFSYHAIAQLDGLTFDASLRSYMAWWKRPLLRLAWFLIRMISGGRLRFDWVRDRAEGWLVGLEASMYESLVIDKASGAKSPPTGKLEPAPVRFR